MLPPNSGISSIEILEQNEIAIERCDIMISVLDYSPGLGVGYELGYAKAKGKIIIAYRSDSESSLGEILEGFWDRMEGSRKASKLSQIIDILRTIKP
jgi:nucleoside 2-deoxyribosyltransferase